MYNSEDSFREKFGLNSAVAVHVDLHHGIEQAYLFALKKLMKQDKEYVSHRRVFWKE